MEHSCPNLQLTEFQYAVISYFPPFAQTLSDCLFPENIHIHPRVVTGKYFEEVGVSKTKQFKGSMKLNCNFRKGGGGNSDQKTLHWRGGEGRNGYFLDQRKIAPSCSTQDKLIHVYVNF